MVVWLVVGFLGVCLFFGGEGVVFKLKGLFLRDLGGFVIWILDKLKWNRIMLGFDMVKLLIMFILVII